MIQKGSLVKYEDTDPSMIGWGIVTGIDQNPPPGYGSPFAHVRLFAQSCNPSYSLAWNYGCPLHCLTEISITEAVIKRMTGGRI